MQPPRKHAPRYLVCCFIAGLSHRAGRHDVTNLALIELLSMLTGSLVPSAKA